MWMTSTSLLNLGDVSNTLELQCSVAVRYTKQLKLLLYDKSGHHSVRFYSAVVSCQISS